MFPIKITPTACKAFLDNLKTDNSENKYIRIAVKGGGCAGFSYVLDIAEKPEDDDLTYEQDGVKFVLDEMSAQYLEGTTIDYSFGLTDSGFQFDNPKAQRSCGCNKSFSI